MNYGSSIQAKQCKLLANILQQQKFADVTFVIGKNKTEFHVNRLFLALISPVFEAMLCGQMKESKPNSNVIIDDITSDAFECVLNFAYCNDPKITAANVLSVRYICDKYQIKLLSDLCDKYINECLTSNAQDVCLLFNSAVQIKSDEIIKKCQEAFKKNPILSGKIIKLDEFLKMNVKAMQIFLSNDYLGMKEDKVWQYVLKWADYQSKNKIKDDEKYDDNDNELKPREYLLKSVAKSIRFGLMDGKYFATKVVPENILSQSELVDVLLYFQHKEAGCGEFNTQQRNGVKYTLNMSSKYGYDANKYEALITTDLNAIAATKSEKNSFIEAVFEKNMTISKIVIAGTGTDGRWGVGYFNGRKLQYKNPNDTWVDIMTFQHFKQGEIQSIDVNVTTTSMRVLYSSSGYTAIGCWRFYE